MGIFTFPFILSCFFLKSDLMQMTAATWSIVMTKCDYSEKRRWTGTIVEKYCQDFIGSRMCCTYDAVGSLMLLVSCQRIISGLSQKTCSWGSTSFGSNWLFVSTSWWQHLAGRRIQNLSVISAKAENKRFWVVLPLYANSAVVVNRLYDVVHCSYSNCGSERKLY